MAVTIPVAGACLIKIASPAAGTLETLGYTINGVQIREEPMHNDVFGDENGGENGVPIDVQYLSEKHTITMELSKYDLAVAQKLRNSYAGATEATPGTAGTLAIQGSTAFRLLLTAAAYTRNYTVAIFRQPRETNVGSKYSKLLLVADCYKNPSTGVLWNSTTS